MFLEKEMYNLTVQAQDHGEPRLSSLAYVIVNVQVRENRNEFEFFKIVLIVVISFRFLSIFFHTKQQDINGKNNYNYILSPSK